VKDHPVRATLSGILLFAIGVAIGAGAFESYRRERDQLKGWQRADGRVVQLLPHAGGQPRPIVGFTAAGGDHIRFTSPAPGRTYAVGDAVPVLYPVVDPSAARIDTPVIRWARTAYAAAGSLVLMALGAYVAWFARRADVQRHSEVE
jgi:hypothetical protein